MANKSKKAEPKESCQPDWHASTAVPEQLPALGITRFLWNDVRWLEKRVKNFPLAITFHGRPRFYLARKGIMAGSPEKLEIIGITEVKKDHSWIFHDEQTAIHAIIGSDMVIIPLRRIRWDGNQMKVMPPPRRKKQKDQSDESEFQISKIEEALSGSKGERVSLEVFITGSGGDAKSRLRIENKEELVPALRHLAGLTETAPKPD